MKTYLFSTLFLCSLLAPKVHFGQAPSLGRAATFGFFTTAGAIGNVGYTTITGDIGTNVGAITGFPPGTFTGTMHIADSVTLLAATNLGTAYGQLTSLTCDSTIGATLGNGQILTPKVYCITTLAALNGNLTLNGEGNPNAIFVIKVNGALSTSNSSSVTLINSANYRNVYWQVNGAFTLGDTSIFRGTVLGNGAINILTNATVFGRALTTAGAINLSTAVGSLPIKLISFNAYCNNNKVNLDWTSASETNNNYYSIERKRDGFNWQVIAKVSGEMHSSNLKQYTFTDMESNNTLSYYRLKQTDLDGQFNYFNTVAVQKCEINLSGILIYPNPTTGSFEVRSNNSISSILVYNILGEKLAEFNYANPAFIQKINLQSYKQGVYFVKVQSAGESKTMKILVN